MAKRYTKNQQQWNKTIGNIINLETKLKIPHTKYKQPQRISKTHLEQVKGIENTLTSKYREEIKKIKSLSSQADIEFVSSKNKKVVPNTDKTDFKYYTKQKSKQKIRNRKYNRGTPEFIELSDITPTPFDTVEEWKPYEELTQYSQYPDVTDVILENVKEEISNMPTEIQVALIEIFDDFIEKYTPETVAKIIEYFHSGDTGFMWKITHGYFEDIYKLANIYESAGNEFNYDKNKISKLVDAMENGESYKVNESDE